MARAWGSRSERADRRVGSIRPSSWKATASRGTARRHYTADDVERLRPVVAKIELDVAVADVIELPFDDDESGEPRLAQSLAQAAPSPHRAYRKLKRPI